MYGYEYNGVMFTFADVGDLRLDYQQRGLPGNPRICTVVQCGMRAPARSPEPGSFAHFQSLGR